MYARVLEIGYKVSRMNTRFTVGHGKALECVFLSAKCHTIDELALHILCMTCT